MDTEPSLVVDLHTVNGAVVLALVGELDLATEPLAKERFRRCLSDKPAGLVVDLSRLTVMQACGIGLLFEAMRSMRRRSCYMCVVTAENTIPHRILHLSAVSSSIPIFINLHEAINAAIFALKSQSEL
jgi:anti-sigma B factor antagonist